MKLHRLELTGFGPFRERQSVDFDAFDGDGVFLISGRTGAGKSSILDGVSFALYGSVPRYDGGERRLRSDHCFLGDPTEVRLEFTTGDRRWRVTRSPEYDRPAKRGGGLTTEPQRAELEENVGGQWIGRAAKPREVAQLLDEVLGLNAQQFQQVILLAQNKFSRFLLATAAERQSLLRTLFGTRRFERYKDDLDTRRKDAQKALDTAGEHARTLLEVAERLITQQALGGDEPQTGPPTELAAQREAATLALQRAEYRVEARAQERGRAETDAAAAEKALADATARAQRLAALATARDELRVLEADADAIAAAREQLTRALAAELLRAPLEAVRRAESAREDAATADRAAREAWTAFGGVADVDLVAEIERITGDLALWEAAAAEERDLADDEATLIAMERSTADLADSLALLDTQQALVPAERERLEGALTAARVRAGRLEEARARRDLLHDQLAAAREAAQLAADAHRAAEAYREANSAAVAAATAVTELLQHRLAGFAGELAAQLTAGEPCAVCGSTAHPRPAAAVPGAVTDDDLTDAEARRDAAATAERAAREAADAARDVHTATLARAAGQDVAALEPLCVAADEGLHEAQAAVADVVGIEKRRAELDELSAQAAAERERLAAQHAADAQRVTALRTSIAERRKRIDAARGEHASVAARVATATARRERARTCVQAGERLAERERAVTEATNGRDELVTASDFASPGEATAALLDPGERALLEERITTHGQQLAAVKGRLLELELDTVDADSPAPAAAREARDAAAAALAAAIEAEAGARGTAERLRELLLSIDDAYAAVAVVADETAVVTRLADSVAGRAPNTMKMDLETFVLAAELEEIVAAANLRLDEMSSGRYSLHHSDAKASHGRASGLGIEVLDAHTGRLRSPQSLSGGETFLASLALALGLAEVVTNRAGGLRLDTLFVDEGFGSLDPETLDLAMRTLDALRAGGRTVGVISHVEAMKEQLPAQLIVEASGDGPSIIRQ